MSYNLYLSSILRTIDRNGRFSVERKSVISQKEIKGKGAVKLKSIYHRETEWRVKDKPNEKRGVSLSNVRVFVTIALNYIID